MPRGNITGRHIQGISTPPAPTPTPTVAGTSADASLSTGRPPVARSTELEGLARLSVSESPAAASVSIQPQRGPVPLCVKFAQALQTPQAKAVQRAQNYGLVWRKLANTGQADTDQQLDLARHGVQSADAGLDALGWLAKQSLITNAHEVRGELLVHLAEAAMAGVKAYHQVVNTDMEDSSEAESDEPDESDESLAFSDAVMFAERMSADKQLKQDWADSPMQELRNYRSVLDNIIDCSKPKPAGRPTETQAMLKDYVPAVTSSQARCRSAMQTLNAMNIMSGALRLIPLIARAALPDLDDRVRDLLDAMNHRHDEVQAAMSALDAQAFWYPGAQDVARPEPLPARVLAGHKALIREHSDRLDRVGERLCVDAAARIEKNDATALWQTMMDVAHVTTAYGACLREQCQSVRGGQPAPAATSGTSMEAPVSKPEASSPVPAPASGAPDRTRSKRGKPPAQPVHAAPAPVLSQPDSRTAEQKAADDLLKRCQVDLETAAWFHGDLVAVACAFGKDTSHIERLMNDPKRDAVVVATSARSQARDWFGTREHLEQAQGRLSADDPRHQRLTDRIRALDLIGRYVDVWEADVAKCALHPKAKYLERLLDLGEIDRIDAPNQLRSSRNKRIRDRVFEIRIQPRRLSSRDADADPGGDAGKRDERYRAWPLFVHLHTSRQVGAGELHKLKFRDVDAAHLKSDAQKNLGPNWERAMHELGYADAKVERSEVSFTLLSRLLAFARRDEGSAGAASSAAEAR
ncbi:putative type III effector protein (Hlk2) (plasmid) [Ralstonia solanacearum PSI07]|nr:putative type III effector protein (Hlk2) [Ralstonia solanacearum PSI07]